MNIDITTLPEAKRREILGRHRDTITLELDGEERPWHLGGASFDFARQEDIDLSEVLDATGEEGVEENIDKFVMLLYVGFMPFDSGITPAEIKLRLSLNELRRLKPKVMGAIQEDAAGGEEAEGKDQEKG